MIIRLRYTILLFLVGITSLCHAVDSQSSNIMTLGMSGSFTGDNASMGEDFSAGARAAFARFKEITDNQIQLITLDDAYDPRQAAPNVRDLIEGDLVAALFGNIGTPTMAVSAPIAIENKILLFAPVTGSSLVRPKTPDRYIINYRASYEEEMTAVFDALMKEHSLTQADIALFSQQDMFGNAGKTYLSQLMQKYNIKPQDGLFQMEYSRNTLAVEHAVADMLIRHPTPKVVFMVGSAGPSAKFIRLTRQYGLDPLFIGMSFMGSRLLMEQLQDTSARILMTQVVPYFNDKSLPIILDFHQDMAQFSPHNDLNSFSLEGYIAARIFTKALPDNLPTSREEIVDMIESLGEFDIGLGIPLVLSPERHQASHSVWLTQLKDGKLIPVPFTAVADLYFNGVMPKKMVGKKE